MLYELTETELRWHWCPKSEPQQVIDILLRVICKNKNILQEYRLLPAAFETAQEKSEISPVVKAKISDKRYLRKICKQDMTEWKRKELNKAIKELNNLILEEQNQGL